MDLRILAALTGIVVVTGIFLSGVELPITGNFYEVDGNNTTYEDSYRSINWSQQPEPGEVRGARYHEDLGNLSEVKFNRTKGSINLSSQEFLEIRNDNIRDYTINFSEEILGLNRTHSLGVNDSVKLRLRNDLMVKSEIGNSTHNTTVRVEMPGSRSGSAGTTSASGEHSRSSFNVTFRGNITEEEFNLVNNLNATVKIVPDTKGSLKERTLFQGDSAFFNSSENMLARLNISNRTDQDGNKIVRIESVGEESEDANITQNQKNYGNHSGNKSTIYDANRSGKGQNSTDNNTVNFTEREIETEAGKMVRIESDEVKDFYIFKYEASRSDATEESAGKDAEPASQQEVVPWNQISQREAEAACRRLGPEYDLPSSEQWLAAAGDGGFRGNTDDGSSYLNSSETCKISGESAWNENYCLTGTGPETWESSEGVRGLKGNLWEWTSDTIRIEDSDYPAGESGYVAGIEKGWPDSLSEEPVEEFDSSFYWSAEEGRYSVRRGGKWSSRKRAGVYSIIVDRKPDESRPGIGFRCVYRPD